MSDLEATVAALHRALVEVEAHPDEEVRATLARLMDALRRLHEEGVQRLASLALANREAAQVALSDPVVANLLHLYGVTDDAEGGPSIVEVLSNAGGREGSSSLQVRLDSGQTVSFVPEENLRRLEKRAREGGGVETARPSEARGRRVAAALDELHAQGLLGKLVHGYPVLIVRAGEGGDDGGGVRDVRAYRNVCPGSLLPLHLRPMEGGTIVCPWHGCRFEAATGMRTAGPGDDLEPLEVVVREGRIEVDLP